MFRPLKTRKCNHKDTKTQRIQRAVFTERLEPQPNGDCRRRRHVRPWASQVPWYYAGGPDVAPGFLTWGATKPKSRSRFPKKSSRYDTKMRISSTETLLTNDTTGSKGRTASVPVKLEALNRQACSQPPNAIVSLFEFRGNPNPVPQRSHRSFLSLRGALRRSNLNAS
jgi:hypothetical protein